VKIGDKVMVPRTGGGESEGEVIEVYTEHARVRFPIGDTFHGQPAPVGVKGCYGYKTLRQDALKVVKED
jgi:hypothetical protein